MNTDTTMPSSTCSLCLVSSAEACTGIEPKVNESVCCLLELEFDQYSTFLEAILICGSCQAFLAQAHQMLETLNNLKKQLLSYCKKLAQMFINMPEQDVGGHRDGHQVDEKPIPVITMSDFSPEQDELVNQGYEIVDQSTTTTGLNPAQQTVDSFGFAPVLSARPGTILTILDVKEEPVAVPEFNEMLNFTEYENPEIVVTGPNPSQNSKRTKKPNQTRDHDTLKLRLCAVRLTDCGTSQVGTNQASIDSEQNFNMASAGEPFAEHVPIMSIMDTYGSSTEPMVPMVGTSKGIRDPEQDSTMASLDETFVEVEHTESSMETCSEKQSVLLNIVPILYTEKNGPSELVSFDIDDSSPYNIDDSTIPTSLEANANGSSPCAFEADSVTTSNYRRSSRIQLKSKTSTLIDETESEGSGSDFEPNDEAEESSNNDSDFELALQDKPGSRIPYSKPNLSRGNRPSSRRINNSFPESINTSERAGARPNEVTGSTKLRNSYLKALTCKIRACNYTAESVPALELHVLEHKFASKAEYAKICCPVCVLRFSVQEQLDSHLARVHSPFTGKPLYRCPTCPKVLTTMVNLRTHYDATHSQIDPETKTREAAKGFFCTIKGCTTRAHCQRTLEVHIRRVHEGDPKPHHCELCTKSYAYRNLLLGHVSSIHTGPNIVCHICGRGFSGNNKLHTHIKQRHAKEAERFSCSVCDKVFYYEKGCKAHERKHRPDSYTCLVNSCDRYKEELGTLEALRAHVQKVHESKPSRNFVCDICGRSFRTKSTFYIHRRSQHGNQPVSCPSCPKTFKSILHLRAHEKVKHPKPDGKVWPCKLCPKAFYCQVYRDRHLNWHKTGKPAWQSLNSHHTGEVPYKRNGVPGSDNVGEPAPTPLLEHTELQALLLSRPQGRTDRAKAKARLNPDRKRKRGRRPEPETSDESGADSMQEECVEAEPSSIQGTEGD